MCGIAGILGGKDAEEMVRRMVALQAHRGPDGARVETPAPGVALGHARLGILDLSERGAQPMRSACGRWTLVFNGELFNYREIARELGRSEWRSATDTEVFLEAVAAWGIEAALARSVGMFAAAFWDHREQALTLVRDRIGEKPLVYYWDGRLLAFASELKALRGLHRARLRPEALDAYLALGFVPAPLAIFENTFKLEAGHWLRFAGGALTIRRWWFPERAAARAARSEAQKIEALQALVADSVRIRLRADVPLALALSGGLDSAVVAFEAARQNAPVRAFTVEFSPRSEAAQARQTALACGLPHEVIAAANPGVAAAVEEMLAQFDEPFADSAAIPAMALGRALRGCYKVMLNGDGGDEAFGGYPHYEFIGAKQAVKAAAAAAGLCDGRASQAVYVHAKTLFPGPLRAQLMGTGDLGAAPLERLLRLAAYAAPPQVSALKRALWFDRHLYLANALTHKMDMALAAYGVEGRAPLLDHRILEWTAGLEDRDLVRGRSKKVLLRRAYGRHLPEAFRQRAKQGFGAPVGAWLAGPLRQQVYEMLPVSWLDQRAQAALLAPGANPQRLWTLFVLARWARCWGISA